VIDFAPTDEQRALRETARAFADRELAPAVERMRAADHAVEPWTVLREPYAKAVELGFVSVLVPKELGGGGGSCVDLVLVLEELGATDVAFAASYVGLTATLFALVARHGTDGQHDAWLEPVRTGRPVLLSGALSEPDRAGSDLFFPGTDASVGPQTRARRDGDHWVLDGAKSAFVTNAGVADAYFVMARTRDDAPPAGSLSMLYTPATATGVSVGPRTRLSGWATSHHAEVRFDDVRLVSDSLVGSEHGAGLVFASCPEIAIGLAAAYVGLARAAYEYARIYASERVSWGAPISRQQTVAMRLAESALDVHSARLVVWDAACAADADPMLGAAKAGLAKVAAVDAAIRCAQRCVETLGGYGVTEEYPAARLLNDAWVGWSCDFTRDMLMLGASGSWD